MPKLSDDEVRDGIAELDGWERADASITRQFEFGGFSDAVAFLVRVAFEAEAANHHPDLDVRYNKVRVVLSTHSEGGITAKDLELARAIQHLAPT